MQLFISQLLPYLQKPKDKFTDNIGLEYVYFRKTQMEINDKVYIPNITGQ